MDKLAIAQLLKKHRGFSGLSVQEVIRQLHSKEIHISEKTLYGYENGISSPNVPTFIALCDIYNISDIIEATNDNHSPLKNSNAMLSTEFLTENEQHFLDLYRGLNEQGRAYMAQQIKFALAQPEYQAVVFIDKAE